MTRPFRPETLAAKAGYDRDLETGAVVPPIHLSTTYARDGAYQLIDGRDYTRDKNPTVLSAERLLCELEGGAAALVNASGMTAATSVFRAWLRAGDHAVVPRVGYFAIRNWLQKFSADWNVALDFVDTTDLAAVAAALRPTTKLVWIETPANPTWDVTDIAAVADLVMHAATSYLNGHYDVLAGALVTHVRDEAWVELEYILASAL